MKPLLALIALTLAAPGAAQTHFSVKVVGQGRPVILIPGLGCDGSVWDATVARLKTRYRCHVLTLAGFAGKPAVPGPVLGPVRDEIIAYVKAKHLDHPAVVGHSLGGFMVFSLAAKEPTLFGPLVAVDGVPWLTVLMNPAATMESAKAIGPMLEKQMSGGTREAFQKGVHAALAGQISSARQVEGVYATAKLSDPTTVGAAMREMITTDLRPEVARIESPVLLFAAGENAKTPEARGMLVKAYHDQIATIPHARLLFVPHARHFVMLDSPDLFLRETEAFLKENYRD